MLIRRTTTLHCHKRRWPHFCSVMSTLRSRKNWWRQTWHLICLMVSSRIKLLTFCFTRNEGMHLRPFMNTNHILNKDCRLWSSIAFVWLKLICFVNLFGLRLVLKGTVVLENVAVKANCVSLCVAQNRSWSCNLDIVLLQD